jgi:hypothetical protein
MKPIYHLISAMILSLFVYDLTNSPIAAALTLCGGFWIDLDHFLDFWLYKGKITYTHEFIEGYNHKFGKMYVLLHSYELLFGVIVIGLVTRSTMILGLGLGASVHLAMDTFGNPVFICTYSLAYRVYKRFDWHALIDKSKIPESHRNI